VIVLRYGAHRLAVLTGGPQDISLGWLPAPGLPPGGLPPGGLPPGSLPLGDLPPGG
jgi:hypothetical protein